MLEENLLRHPNERIDADGNLEARKKDIAENGFGDSLEWQVTEIWARIHDDGYPTDEVDERTVEAFRRDFKAQDPREQPNIEGFNLRFSTTSIREGVDLYMDSVSPERREELYRKYGSPDLVNDFFNVNPEPVIIAFDSQGNLHRVGKSDPDYPYKKLG